MPSLSANSMQIFWSFAGFLLIIATLPGTLELAFLSLSGLFTRRTIKIPVDSSLLRLCVVVPAHNEESEIGNCVSSLLACDERGVGAFVVVVVADNCTDATAERASSAGVRVLERYDDERHGKGFALAYAFSLLLPEGYDAFLIVDADTVVEGNFIQATANLFAQGADALQCRNLVSNPEKSIRARLMHVASLAFNILRPRGREYWRLSVGILGNGFGLSRGTLEIIPFDADSLAEDLEYHLRLVRAGRRVSYCEDTTVWSAAPSEGKSAANQQARWEGGRFRMIQEQAPSLAWDVLNGRLKLLEPLLELLLLPLGFHVFLLLCLLAVPFPLGRVFALVGLVGVGLHVIAGLYAGRAGWRDAMVLLVAPFYILWKLSLGPHIFKSAGTGATWQRTERSDKR
jgi:cellulose synthase/poly-beta-1,6-N-acetylglucosamine synthase-like glycosyltransferase